MLPASRTYRVGPSSITLAFENILKSDAQVLVSSDDYMLSMGGGVSAAIRIAAGSQVVEAARKCVPADAGDVVVTSGGGLKARFVFHAVTIGRRRSDRDHGAIVRTATRRALDLLPLLNCRSIAFPALGTGVAGISFETAAAEMAGALVSGLLASPDALDVRLCLGRGGADAESFFALFETFAARKLGLFTSGTVAGRSLSAPSDERGGLVFGMLRHLDSRRARLEAELVPALNAETPAPEGSLERLRSQLAELQELRRGYEAELAPVEGSRSAAPAGSVFLSSTSMDLQPHRLAVRKVIDGLGLKFIGMEEFAASGKTPATLIRDKVDEANHYLGVIGMRYGYVDPGSGLSMTELEYRQAVASGKTVFLFVMDKSAPITAGMVESDPQGYAKLLEFREKIMKAHTCGLFTSTDDLTKKVELALKELK